MPPLLPFALVFTFSAFFCYTASIWSGLLSGKLRRWHLVTLWVGLGCDVCGTGLMTVIAGGVLLTLHGLSGYLAIALMAVLAILATRLYRSGQEKGVAALHRWSLLVWVLWMIPLVNGIIAKIPRMVR
jgi:uncharacterized repeat protein (TIGR03987 family)